MLWLIDVYTFYMSSSCHEVYLFVFICCVQIFSFSLHLMSLILLNFCDILATCLSFLVLFFFPTVYFVFPLSFLLCTFGVLASLNDFLTICPDRTRSHFIS